MICRPSLQKIKAETSKSDTKNEETEKQIDKDSDDEVRMVQMHFSGNSNFFDIHNPFSSIYLNFNVVQSPLVLGLSSAYSTPIRIMYSR